MHWELLRQDLRYAVRTLGRVPGFAITAILVIALGVGANTAAFSVADHVLLRPLPFPHPERLVKLWQHESDYARVELSPGQLSRLARDDQRRSRRWARTPASR